MFGKKYLIRAVAITGLMSLLFGTVSASAKENSGEVLHKIGVAVYDLNDNEVKMFQRYYQEYIESSFLVEFIYSPSLRTLEDEEQFISDVQSKGAEGIISFTSYDLNEVVDACIVRIHRRNLY